MRNTLGFLLSVGIFSCSSNSSDELWSPSKRVYYKRGVYDINTNKVDGNKLGFTLFDSSGRRVESTDLSEAGVQNIGIGWHNTGDTLILNLHSKGVYAYQVGPGGTQEIHVDSLIKSQANRLR